MPLSIPKWFGIHGTASFLSAQCIRQEPEWIYGSKIRLNGIPETLIQARVI